MNSRLSKIRSVHAYIYYTLAWTVYFEILSESVFLENCGIPANVLIEISLF